MGGPTWNFGGGPHLPLPRHWSSDISYCKQQLTNSTVLFLFTVSLHVSVLCFTNYITTIIKYFLTRTSNLIMSNEPIKFQTHHFDNSYILMNIHSLHRRQNKFFSCHNNDFISWLCVSSTLEFSWYWFLFSALWNAHTHTHPNCRVARS